MFQLAKKLGMFRCGTARTTIVQPRWLSGFNKRGSHFLKNKPAKLHQSNKKTLSTLWKHLVTQFIVAHFLEITID